MKASPAFIGWTGVSRMTPLSSTENVKISLPPRSQSNRTAVLDLLIRAAVDFRPGGLAQRPAAVGEVHGERARKRVGRVLTIALGPVLAGVVRGDGPLVGAAKAGRGRRGRRHVCCWRALHLIRGSRHLGFDPFDLGEVGAGRRLGAQRVVHGLHGGAQCGELVAGRQR